MRSREVVVGQNIGDFEVWGRRGFKTSDMFRMAGKALKGSLEVMEGE